MHWRFYYDCPRKRQKKQNSQEIERKTNRYVIERWILCLVTRFDIYERPNNILHVCQLQLKTRKAPRKARKHWPCLASIEVEKTYIMFIIQKCIDSCRGKWYWHQHLFLDFICTMLSSRRLISINSHAFSRTYLSSRPCWNWNPASYLYWLRKSVLSLGPKNTATRDYVSTRRMVSKYWPVKFRWQ